MPSDCVRSEPVASVAVADAQHFWKAIKLCVTKPHTINRILLGGEIVKIYQLSDTDSNVNGHLIDRITSILIGEDRANGVDQLVERFLASARTQYETLAKETFVASDLDRISIVISKYFPRNLKIHQNSWELVLLGECKPWKLIG